MTEYLSCAIQASIEGGSEIMDVYSDPSSDFQIEKKADDSPVTIADKRAHLIISSLLSATPFPVLSEEGKLNPYSLRKNWNTLWIVDPLDGTKEFIKRNGEFTVNIALVDHGRPVLGVIYAPVQKVLYFGTENGGAYKLSQIDCKTPVDTEKLRVNATPLPQAKPGEAFVIVASRSHLSPETGTFIEQQKTKYPEIELISKGSSLKICLVAEGKADVYPRFAPTMEWDTAAGHAILKGAGGDIYQTDGTTPLTYNKEDLLNPWFIAKLKK